MITRFITEVSSGFNPFSSKAKTARLFLSCLPPDARQAMKINTKLLPRGTKEASSLRIKFKDGRVMDLDPENSGLRDLEEEADRHSRMLRRKEELGES